MRAVYRYEVPVDAQWHTVELSGPVLHVAARDPRRVELWAVHGVRPPQPRTFRVFGTGEPLDDRARVHVGTALAAGGLVWHLWERQ